MWAIRGRIVALSSDPTVAPNEAAVFTGRVWVGDDGTIVGGHQGLPGRATRAPTTHPSLTSAAPSSCPDWSTCTTISPTTPCRCGPSRRRRRHFRITTPGPEPSYAASTTWPAYALITACPQELLAYVEAKAIVGGTTSIQGSPPKNRPRDGWLVRNIEDETFGSRDANLIYASVLTAKPAALAERANKMRAGSAFIYHCSEGQRGSDRRARVHRRGGSRLPAAAVHRSARQRR